jgi:hypothetical protein
MDMIQIMIFWDVMPYSLISGYQHFGKTSSGVKYSVGLYMQDVGKVTRSSMHVEEKTELMSQKN